MELKQRKKDAQGEAKALLKPGMILYGYCGGRFGRGSYGDKTIVEIFENYILYTEDGSKGISFEITDWIQLISDSNKALAEQTWKEDLREVADIIENKYLK